MTDSAPLEPELNKTLTRTMSNVTFDTLPPENIRKIFKDGRILSHFMEHWLSQYFGLKYVTGCKDHDLVCPSNPDVKYDQKTFTQNGCKFMPSNMIGQGRHFDKAKFDEKSSRLIYIIVSNIDFPEIKIRFVRGSELARMYPTGSIPSSHHDKFFNN